MITDVTIAYAMFLASAAIAIWVLVEMIIWIFEDDDEAS